MAKDNIQIRRSTGEEKQVMHDQEMADLKEREDALLKNIADRNQLSALQAQFNSNKTYGRIQSLQCSRDESPPPPPPPKGTPEMTQWDGVNRGSLADEYLKNARGGLDAVHGDTWHYQQSLSVQDAAISEGIGAVLGKLLQIGGRLLGATMRKVKPSAPRPEPTAKPASSGDGLYVAKPVPKHPPGTRPASEEIKDLSKFEGKSKTEIEQELREAGYTEVRSNDGTGSVWTKAGSDGNTAAVRLDPPSTAGKGYADEVPHAHKEIVASDRVVDGNYRARAQKFDDNGNIKNGTNAEIAEHVHIPIKW